MAATVLAVLLAQLPAAAANSPVEDLEADLCPSGASAAGPVQLAGDVTGAAETLTVGCDATVDLNGHTLTVGNVIITPGTTFTITDTSAGEDGVLTANAPQHEAGIRTTGATLIIEAGTVNATGGERAAGIGGRRSLIGGVHDRPGASGGTVIINGGTVVAQGGDSGAGIGAGDGGTEGGTVTISGGTVTATGGAYGGAGIGGGGGSGNLDDGIGAEVTISGGTITAIGGESAAGIGGGATGGDGGTLTVTDGTVTATGGSSGGAGIGGGGSSEDGGGNGASVTITGGTVTATGGAAGPLLSCSVCLFSSGAGIGGGGAYDLTSSTYISPAGDGGTVVIDGGVVTATAGSAAAATIGAGGDLGDPDLSGAPGTLTLGEFAVRVDDGLTTTITFEIPADDPTDTDVTTDTTVTTDETTDTTEGTSTDAAPSTPVRTGGSLPSLSAGDAAWSRADGTVTPLAATSAGPRTVTYGSAPASVTITGAPGTAADRGVVADPDGELVAEVCLALPVGSVIEVWVLSSPRLVAAHLVTDAPCQRFAVPFVAPLDAGGAIAPGAHTLQLALTTAGGMEAVNIGITVSGPVPSSVPAGEGGMPTPWSVGILLTVVLALLPRTMRHRANLR